MIIFVHWRALRKCSLCRWGSSRWDSSNMGLEISKLLRVMNYCFEYRKCVYQIDCAKIDCQPHIWRPECSLPYIDDDFVLRVLLPPFFVNWDAYWALWIDFRSKEGPRNSKLICIINIFALQTCCFVALSCLCVIYFKVKFP